jgi:hypothetical protein
MATRTEWWKAAIWRLTALGRARLALERSERRAGDPMAAAKLVGALSSVRHPSRAAKPTAIALQQQVLARLVELAFQQSDYTKAAAWLGELDQCGGERAVGRNLRWPPAGTGSAWSSRRLLPGIR